MLSQDSVKLAFHYNNSDLLRFYNIDGSNDGGDNPGIPNPQINFDLGFSVTNSDNITSDIIYTPLIYRCFLGDLDILCSQNKYKKADNFVVGDSILSSIGPKKILSISKSEVFQAEKNEDWKLYSNGTSTFSHWHKIMQDETMVFVHEHKDFSRIEKSFPYLLYNFEIENNATMITKCGNIIESLVY
jgi:hypothetical protein